MMKYRLLDDFGPFVAGSVVAPTTKACKLSIYDIGVDDPRDNSVLYIPTLYLEMIDAEKVCAN